MSEGIVLERPLNLTEGADNRLKRQRVYIFLSRHGLVFTVLLVVMLLGAVNYNNSMAYVLVFLLSSLFMVCMLHTYKNLRGLVINTTAPSAVFAGEIAYFPLLFDNRAGTTRIGLELGPYPKGMSRKERKLKENHSLLANLDSGQLAQELIPVTTIKRGSLVLGRVRITSTYPLGLFRAWSYIPTSHKCIVYPKPLGTNELPFLTEFDLEEQSGNKTGADDFVGFRQYRQGDSIRNIDWKAVARERGLHIKRFSGSGANKLILHWEHTSHLADTEQRLSQLCKWVLEAEKQGHHYGLELPDSSLQPATGEGHKHQCLEKLAAYGLAGS